MCALFVAFTRFVTIFDLQDRTKLVISPHLSGDHFVSVIASTDIKITVNGIVHAQTAFLLRDLVFKR